MLFIVVALFGLCWLPYQMYNILQEIYPEINRYVVFYSYKLKVIRFEMHSNSSYLLIDLVLLDNRYRYINLIWFSCHFLAMSNSCYNPFIYAIYSVSQTQLHLSWLLRKQTNCWSQSPNLLIFEMFGE